MAQCQHPLLAANENQWGSYGNHEGEFFCNAYELKQSDLFLFLFPSVTKVLCPGCYFHLE